MLGVDERDARLVGLKAEGCNDLNVVFRLNRGGYRRKLLGQQKESEAETLNVGMHAMTAITKETKYLSQAAV